MRLGTEHTYALQTGELTISIDVNQSQMGPSELFKVAERYNPKRSFLFISTLLGKHYPTSIKQMNRAVYQLTDQLPDDINHFAVIGMAETAIGLGAAVYQNCIKRYGGGLFGTSTRYPGKSEVIGFTEPHSHAAEQGLCPPDKPEIRTQLSQCEDLILVDDELTTGKTMNNLANALIKQRSMPVKRVFILSLTDWSEKSLQVEIPAHIRVVFISVIKGEYRWAGNGNRFSLPSFKDSNTSTEARMASIQSPRYWINSIEALANFPSSVKKFINEISLGDKVLVVGTGEFMAKPLHVAQMLEHKGAIAYLSSTTRSPAITSHEQGYFSDYGVKSRVSFADLYLGAGSNYLYNTDIESWDRVLLYTDAPLQAIPDHLIAHLKPDLIASEFELIEGYRRRAI